MVLKGSIQTLLNAREFVIFIELNKAQCETFPSDVLQFINEKTQDWKFVYNNKFNLTSKDSNDFKSELSYHFENAPGQIDCINERVSP